MSTIISKTALHSFAIVSFSLAMLPLYVLMAPFGAAVHGFALSRICFRGAEVVDGGVLSKSTLFTSCLVMFASFVLLLSLAAYLFMFAPSWAGSELQSLVANRLLDISVFSAVPHRLHQEFALRYGANHADLYVVALFLHLIIPVIYPILFPRQFLSLVYSVFLFFGSTTDRLGVTPRQIESVSITGKAVFILAFLGAGLCFAVFFEFLLPVQRLGGFSHEYSVSDLFSGQFFVQSWKSIFLIATGLSRFLTFAMGGVAILVFSAVLGLHTSLRS